MKRPVHAEAAITCKDLMVQIAEIKGDSLVCKVGRAPAEFRVVVTKPPGRAHLFQVDGFFVDLDVFLDLLGYSFDNAVDSARDAQFFEQDLLFVLDVIQKEGRG